MSRSGAEIRSSENQSKFIQERISAVEKHFGDLCINFANYIRKLSSVRDRGDELGKSVMTYSEHERLNHSTKSSLKEFAEYFSSVQDYRETEIKRLNAKVIDPLTNYGAQCKQAKVRLKSAFSARDKELKQQKKLQNVRDSKPSDRQTISRAEMDLHQASVDATDSSRRLEDEMDRFEKKKLQDIKQILLNFVNIELLYHAKALEMYTLCFNSLNIIDEEEDLEEFRSSLRPESAQAQRLARMQLTGSRQSLNSTGQSRSSGGPSTPTMRPSSSPQTSQPNASLKSSLKTPSPNINKQPDPKRTPQQQPKQHQQQTPQQNGYNGNSTLQSTHSSMYTTQDEDDDDDEYDDEDDEYTDEEDESPRQPPPPKQQKEVRYNMFQAQPSPQANQRRK